MGRRILIALWAPVLAAQIVPGKYIVELTDAPASRIARGRRSALANARAGVRARQSLVQTRLESLGAKIVDRLDTLVNAIVVEIPDAAAGRLENEAGVLHVWPVYRMRATLDHALPLLKVPDAWNAVGGMTNAGAGIKIGVIDSGITPTSAAFQDAGFSMPAGFPVANRFSDLAFTNNKVIVARNYVAGSTPDDRFGHGTAVAMAAAGVTNTGPLTTITGVAPGAWLGSYKLNDTDSFDSNLLLAALQDAVNDGMDVVNISSGIAVAPRLSVDLYARAVEAAVSMGTLVVVAAGNLGSAPNTITSPGTAPSAITVGASENDRIYTFAAVAINGTPAWVGEPANGPSQTAPITARVVDVATLDGSGEACGILPPHGLDGVIALIMRSLPNAGCTFEQKLGNAQNAGAIGAVVYTNAASPGLVIMDVGSATLPAISVDHASGLAIQSHLRDVPPPAFTMQWTTAAIQNNANLLADFSGRGPNVNLSVKPDLVAVGEFLYLATETVNPRSFLYDSSGYLAAAAGTSFSTPLVTGAVALVKAARPALTNDEYRSLIVNSATPMRRGDGSAFPVQAAGAGLLNVYAALQNTIAVSPVSLSFGMTAGTVDTSATLTLTNLSMADDTLAITAEPMAGPALTLDSPTLPVAAGTSRSIPVHLAASTLAPGEYQGYLHIHGSHTSVDTVVPYWYAVSDQTPAAISILLAPGAGSTGSLQPIIFRVVDRAGIPVPQVKPTSGVLVGGGLIESVLSNDFLSPGVFATTVRLGFSPGQNVFEIDAGNARTQVAISGN